MFTLIKTLISRIAHSWQSTVVACKLSGRSAKVGPPRLVEGSQYVWIDRGSCLRDGAWLGAYPELLPETIARDFRIVIHANVYIGFFATITAVNLVEIGAGTVVSDHFYASDHVHGYDPRRGSPAEQPLESKGPVIIGRNCFIGMRVSVLPGVTLGDNCVVGAHSVVTRSFPACSMIVGAPARLVKTFDTASGAWAAAEPLQKRECR